MQVGKAKGVLKNFLIEPFVPHTQVLFKIILMLFKVLLLALDSSQRRTTSSYWMSNVRTSSVDVHLTC